MTNTLPSTSSKNSGFTPRRVRAFGGHLKRVKVLVYADEVKVYDPVAGHFTSCHSLSDREVVMIRNWAKGGELVYGMG